MAHQHAQRCGAAIQITISWLGRDRPGQQWVRKQNSVPLLSKMRSSKLGDNEVLQEIAMLQALDGWSWEVTWVPRERNEAADALSKNDMQRFESIMGAGMTEVQVAACHAACRRRSKKR